MRLLTLNDIYLADPHSVMDGIMCYLGFSSEPQYHDFYEITIVIHGTVEYVINGIAGRLKEYSLILIRPGDKHFKFENSNAKLINLGFTTSVIQSLLNYLGTSFNLSVLTSTPMPPIVSLSERDVKYFSRKINALHDAFIQKQQVADMELKIILLEIVVRLFAAFNPKGFDRLPTWLKKVVSEISKVENFTVGLRRLIEISGKSQSAICKAFSKYFGITPTDYINRLRLEYCRELLRTTDESITAIAYMSGFENLSHFHHCFKNAYHFTPKQYRNHYSNISGDCIIHTAII